MLTMDDVLKSQVKSVSYGRSQTFEARAEETKADELTFSFSSEAPVERWWGTEVLSHAPGAARLQRLNDRGAFLFNHNRNFLLGSTIKAWLEASRAYVTVQWSGRDDVKGYRQDVDDGHLTHVSFAYDIYEIVEKTKTDEYLITDWEAFEVSLVTIAADPTVGIGRSSDKSLIFGAERPLIVMPHERSKPSALILPTLSRKDDGQECDDEETVDEEMPQETKPAQEKTEAEKSAKPILSDPIVVPKQRERTKMEIEEILQQERDRAKSIRALGDEHNCRDLAENFVNDGSEIEKFREAILSKISERQQQPVAQPAKALGLSDNEQKRYSVLRALNAAVTGNWKGAGFEKECNDFIANQRDKDAGLNGFYIPVYDLRVSREAAKSGRSAVFGKSERATYATSTSNVGGVAVETQIYPDMIDYLRNIPLVAQFGAKFWSGLEGNLDILRQLTYTNVGWIAEDDSLPEGNATFGSFGLRAKDVGAWSRITRRMLLQSSIDIENFVREELILGIALEIDRAAIHGTGIGNEPRGIINTPGIGSVALGANGAIPTWDAIVRLETLVAKQNALMTNVGYMTTPDARGKLKTTLKAAAASSEFIWQDSGQMTPSGNLGTLNGYQAGATNQVRSDLTKGTGTLLSAIIFGNWSEVIIGEWGFMKIDVNPYGDLDFLKDAIKVKAIHTLDIQVGRPIAFAACTDVVTT